MSANDNTIDTTSAEFIARAVKSHHALVAALEALAEQFPIRRGNEKDAATLAFAYIVIANARGLK